MSIIKKIQTSLSLKLSLANLVLALLIFFVAMGFLFMQSIRIVRQEAVEHATCVLKTTQLHVSQYINEVETATNNTDWLVVEHFIPDSLMVYSRRIVELNPNISGCSITAEPDYFPQMGRYFSAYTVRHGDTIKTEREAGYEYYDKVWYKTPRELGHSSWVDPFNDFNAGTLSAEEMIASYCKPLFDNMGKFIGVISTDLSLPMLSSIISKEKPYPHSYFVMLGKEGHYFVHPDTSMLVNKTIFAEGNPVISALGHEMLARKRGNYQVTVNGESCIVCYEPLPNTPWSIALISPEKDIFSKYVQLVYFILPLVLVGIGLILLLTHVVISYTVRPLNRLAELARFIADGHYENEMPHSHRIDAVGRLQNSFVTMQEALNDYLKSIEKINSEMAQHNEELAEANRQAREGARQKKLFIQNMTHQIRTPLNIILGFSQVLRDEGAKLPDEELKNMTMMIDRNTVTIGRMVAMLYDSSDMGTVGLSRDDGVCVNEMAHVVIEDSVHQNPNLKVDFHSDVPDSFYIRSNRLYMFRSMRELLYNSAKYSYEGKVSIRIAADEDMVRITIEDIGPGIAEKDLEHLFQPFTKTNDLSEGLGLGLPLTRRHARNLGGDLIIDTSYTKGCRMIIELPNNSNLVGSPQA